MTDEMATFRRNADRLGLCEVFSQRWADCKSKKQLYDLACDVNSLAYIADMICRGYGLSEEYLTREFGQFLNGKCVYDKDGYSSCIYCRPPEGEITISMTAILVIGFDGRIIIPQNHICEIYLCKCNVGIYGKGKGVVYAYDSTIANRDSAPIVIKEDKRY